MSKPYVFIDEALPMSVEKYLAKYCTYTMWSKSQPVPTHTLQNELKKAAGAMLTQSRPRAADIAHAPHLKVISTATVGYDHLDVAMLAAHGITVTNTPYVLDETVADLIFGLILSGCRRIAELHTWVRAGGWNQVVPLELYGQDVYNKTLGIIGMGRIGEKIAHRAKHGFNMSILYHNRSQRPEEEKLYDAKKVDLTTLLETADVVVIMVPLTKETTHLIGAKELAKMKPTAVLVNGARGAVIDEDALIAALKQQQIWGAALDVFEQEPLPSGHPFLTLENVTLTPHIGSATAATREAMAQRAAENLVAGLNGQQPQDIVENE
ncbi:D-glycerate dehydrogenase [Bacillus sp. FSL W7-1360]